MSQQKMNLNIVKIANKSVIKHLFNGFKVRLRSLLYIG
jgi:hypothetical protein